MRQLRLFTLAIALILSGGTRPIAQSGMSCLYNWANLATPDTPSTPAAVSWQKTILRTPEFRNMVSRCSQNQAEAVPWDQLIRALEDMEKQLVEAARPVRNGVLGLIEMLRKERERVRDAAFDVEQARNLALDRMKPLDDNRPAAAAGRGTDSNARSLDIGPMINQPVKQPDRLIVDPAFRSWVPRLLREAVASRHGFEARIIDFKGEASIRRGNKVARISDLLMRGNAWNLQAGDIFEVHQGHIEFDFGNGARYTLQAGGTLMMHMDAQCMTRRNALTGRLLRDSPTYLIQGALLYATTTNAVQASCAVAVPGVIVSTRGTSFTVRHTPAELGGTMEVAVTSGLVDVTDTDTGQVWELRPGESRTLKVLEPLPPVDGNDFLVTNQCPVSVRFRLFELDRQGRLIATWPEDNLGPGRMRAIAISDPVVGNQVCYGAASADGRSWGVGPEGDKDCDRCCWTTRQQPAFRRVNLTCR